MRKTKFILSMTRPLLILLMVGVMAGCGHRCRPVDSRGFLTITVKDHMVLCAICGKPMYSEEFFDDNKQFLYGAKR